MKIILAILLVCAALSFAKEGMNGTALKGDSVISVSVDPALTDSVNISDLVKDQIEAAQAGVIKSGMNYQIPEEVKPEPVKKAVKTIRKNNVGLFEEFVFLMKDFNSKYLNVVILVSASVLILGFVFGRRLLQGIGRPGKRLKKSINLIRSEKPLTLKNKKLNQLRSRLSETNNIYDVTEENVSGKARNMNVGKGELILAAKVKAFQLSKISK